MGQPYINPNYFAQYPQYFQPQPQTNPYIQRMEQLQQYQQSLQQPLAPTQMSVANQMATLGKIVDSIDVVKATDVPMDGNVYYFPTADGSAVFGKQWTMDGKTRILTYKPFEEPNPNEVSYEQKESILEDFRGVLEGIQMDIQTLNDKVDRLGKSKTAKKEVADE